MSQFDVPANTAAELQAKSADADFWLTDAEGGNHHYTVWAHGTTDGQAIVFTLLGLGAKPLLRLVGDVRKIEGAVDKVVGIVRDALGSDDKSDAPVDDKISETLGSLLEHVDFAQIGDDVQTIVQTMPLGALAIKILAHTNRDGTPLFRPNGTPNTFDEVYKRNWIEYGMALWKVIDANRFFPLPDTSSIATKPTTSPAPSEKPTIVPASSG